MANTIVYLNGDYMPQENATISVMDRGFLFGDGVYEVIPVIGDRLLRLDGHMVRLQNSLDRISLANPCSAEEWQQIFDTLLAKNADTERAIYLQITRGVYPRRNFSTKTAEPVAATVFVMVMPVAAPDVDVVSAGISVITVDDFRWNACDIKSTSLLASVMLKQQATVADVDDAILVKNGIVTEGTSSNVFLVKDNVLITPPTGHELLPGITRELVIEIAKNNAIVVEERQIEEQELYQADEIWMTSSTREIAPVIQLNGESVSAGAAGPLWQRVVDLYQQYKQVLRQDL